MFCAALGSDLGEMGKRNLRDFVESGKGILVLHHGILNFQKWPWWYEEVIGGWEDDRSF